MPSGRIAGRPHMLRGRGTGQTQASSRYVRTLCVGMYVCVRIRLPHGRYGPEAEWPIEDGHV